MGQRYRVRNNMMWPVELPDQRGRIRRIMPHKSAIFPFFPLTTPRHLAMARQTSLTVDREPVGGFPPTQPNLISQDVGSSSWTTIGLTRTAGVKLTETADDSRHVVRLAAPATRAAGRRSYRVFFDVEPPTTIRDARVSLADSNSVNLVTAQFDLVSLATLDVYASGWDPGSASAVRLTGGRLRLSVAARADDYSTGLLASLALLQGIYGDSYPGDPAQSITVAQAWAYDSTDA